MTPTPLSRRPDPALLAWPWLERRRPRPRRRLTRLWSLERRFAGARRARRAGRGLRRPPA